MENDNFMKVESIAECSLYTFDRHKAIIGNENQDLVFNLSGHLRQVLLHRLTDLLLLSMFFGSSSRCRGLVCSVCLWYFLIILAYFLNYTRISFHKNVGLS